MGHNDKMKIGENTVMWIFGYITALPPPPPVRSLLSLTVYGHRDSAVFSLPPSVSEQTFALMIHFYIKYICALAWLKVCQHQQQGLAVRANVWLWTLKGSIGSYCHTDNVVLFCHDERWCFECSAGKPHCIMGVTVCEWSTGGKCAHTYGCACTERTAVWARLWGITTLLMTSAPGVTQGSACRLCVCVCMWDR